jgi:hypothetical protein
MKALTFLSVASIALGFMPGGLSAQQVDRTLPAEGDGSIKIAISAGAVRVVAWDKDSVRVTGELGEGMESLDFSVRGPETRIRVVPDPGAGTVSGSEIEVHAPRRSHIAARTAGASVEIVDLQGGVDVTTISGTIRISGAPRTVFAESGTGDVFVDGRSKIVRAHSVDGGVTLRGAHGFVNASTVSGDLIVVGEELWEGELTSVAGDIVFEGSFEPGAELFYFENHSGGIDLRLPPLIAADFTITALGAPVENEFADGSERVFTTGKGGPQLRIKSFKGPVRIRKATRPSG